MLGAAVLLGRVVFGGVGPSPFHESTLLRRRRCFIRPVALVKPPAPQPPKAAGVVSPPPGSTCCPSVWPTMRMCEPLVHWVVAVWRAVFR
jgi:hypothetical protein